MLKSEVNVSIIKDYHDIFNLKSYPFQEITCDRRY